MAASGHGRLFRRAVFGSLVEHLRPASTCILWRGSRGETGMISFLEETASPVAARAMRNVSRLSRGGPLDPSLRITINFHPDRAAGAGTVLTALAADGVYRSQFVTGTSNGSLTAHVGGDRWRWESAIFAGAYDGAPPHLRPVYGALDHERDPFGAAPRFGSSYLRLTAETCRRATFCYPDSSDGPVAFGTADRMSLVGLARSAAADDGDPLNRYVEAHVHGPVVLGRDVDLVVLDPCYRGTEVEAQARLLGVSVEWHPGFRLTVDELRRHVAYRGQEFVDLGCEIAVDGLLDPAVIGDAVRGGRYHPQSVKQVWHCVAQFGRQVPTERTDHR